MRLILFSLAFTGLSVAVSPAFADLQDNVGCGLGTQIFHRNSWLSAQVAYSTNATGRPSSMTSSTSGCQVDGIFVRRDALPMYYAEARFTDLQSEMAQGGGEALAAFAQTLGCKREVIPAFGATMRSHYEAIFPSESTRFMEMLKAVKSAVKADPVLAKSCDNFA